MPAGYSRDLTYDSRTGQVVILGNEGISTIVYADTDFGDSAGTYYCIVNRLTGQVIGTSNNTTDANIGNGTLPTLSWRASERWRTPTPSTGTSSPNRRGGDLAE